MLQLTFAAIMVSTKSKRCCFSQADAVPGPLAFSGWAPDGIGQDLATAPVAGSSHPGYGALLQAQQRHHSQLLAKGHSLSPQGLLQSHCQQSSMESAGLY